MDNVYYEESCIIEKGEKIESFVIDNITSIQRENKQNGKAVIAITDNKFYQDAIDTVDPIFYTYKNAVQDLYSIPENILVDCIDRFEACE